MSGGRGGGGLPPQLQARLDDLWFENYAAWARAHPRGRVEELGGWRIASLGSPWPFYNVATQVPGAAPEVDRLRLAFEPDGYRVWVRDGMENLEADLLGAGFFTELQLDAFVRDLAMGAPVRDGPRDAVPAGYEVGRATSRDEIEECVWGDRMSPWLDVGDVKAAFPDPYQMAQAADRRFYQVRHGDRLVATGQSLLHQGVAGVYAMWTAGPHRSRGLASALLRLIRDDAAAAGATHMTLQAAQPGGGLYARAGFERRYAYRVYGEGNQGRWTSTAPR
jgi:ribosomal protein S18 acetylase RimI-like enzyme